MKIILSFYSITVWTVAVTRWWDNSWLLIVFRPMVLTTAILTVTFNTRLGFGYFVKFRFGQLQKTLPTPRMAFLWDWMSFAWHFHLENKKTCW
jgi:hypothetical protein